MKPISFKHGDATFTVRPQTVFDRDSLGYMFNDIGTAIVTGYGIESLSETPLTLDVMMTKYIRWMMVTAIDGDTGLPVWGDWFDYATRSKTVYDDFIKWLAIIREDESLTSKWSNAYDKSNQITISEKDEKKEVSSGV